MGYFDAISASAFKTDEHGRWLYFPWGIFGRGYVVPTEAERQRLRQFLVRSLQVFFAAAILLSLTAPISSTLLLIVPYTIAHVVWVRRATAGWERSPERLSFHESLGNQARNHSRVSLWLMFIFSLFFVLAGVLILVTLPHMWLTGASSILFFGACAAFFWRMLMVATRS